MSAADIECPDDLPEPFDFDAEGRAADDYRDAHPKLVSVYRAAGNGPMTDEQVRAEMSRLVGFRLTIKQALS